MNSPILTTGARLLVPLFLVFSIYTLLRGHNAPGGGFIGGLIAACGIAIHAFANGTVRTRSRLHLDPRSIALTGMALALVSGAVTALVGLDPFAGIWGEVFGIKLSNILLFDTGVYLAVAGGILTLVFALEGDD